MNFDEQGHRQDIVSIAKVIGLAAGGYLNQILTAVNDHVVRISVMTEPYFWHLHPGSDETFLVLEGSLGIELEDREAILMPGEMMTIPKGTAHRTRPIGGRSVNLTMEHGSTSTERIDMPGR
jgi:mannose-6-phosphate isomerase-like protein (cupin superfamily)